MIQALTEAGIEVVRVTRSSISIADPNGGKNIRLKGAFYEQSFTDGRGVREKLKERAESTEKMLNDEFRKLEESVNRELTSNESLIRNAINDHTTALKELLERYQKTTISTMDTHWQTVLKMSVKRWLWLIIVSVLMFATTGSLLWYQGMKINANMNILREQKESLEKLNAKTWGVRYHEDSNGRFLCVAEGDESRNELDGGQRQTECSETGTGVTEHDGAGKHLLNALEQLQQDYMQRLNEWESAFVGIAENVFAYATDNAMLNERAAKLSQQVQREIGKRLSQLYSEKFRR